VPVLSGGVRVVHDGSVLFGRCRPARRWLGLVREVRGRGAPPRPGAGLWVSAVVFPLV